MQIKLNVPFMRMHITFKQLLSFLLVVTFIVQLAVITYNYITGYIEISGIGNFLFRLGFGTLLSTMVGFLLAYPDIYIIRLMNSYFPWDEKPVIRILVQLALGLTVAVAYGYILTLTAHAINPYEEGLRPVMITNILISSVVNILFLSLLEGWQFFSSNRRTTFEKEALERELSSIRFEVLKNQINPHFLFNSLNVLSGLIERDRSKAQDFIDEFSHVYRYVLDTIEKPVVPLSGEINFAESYIFLQRIRYGNGLDYMVNIDAAYLGYFLPPLSLQLVLENAIKHNQISEKHPLVINLYMENERLIVENNLRQRISRGRLSGLGQKNLERRYALVAREVPVFKIKHEKYIVELPLIRPE